MAFTKKTVLELLRRAHGQERLAHAYLISGSQGSGKRELAGDLAALVTNQPALRAPQSAFDHPDIHIAEPESKSRRIVIDQVRALEKELQMCSMLGGKKVGIIFEADRLKVEASNAFLKTLEEPPNNSLLLLTTSQPETLPDTILSRCISIALCATEKRGPTDGEQRLLDTLRHFFSKENNGIAPAFGLVRELILLLQQTRQAIQDDIDSQQKKEEAAYKQTTDGEWLKEREEHHKALAESRYVQERFRLADVLLNWWADVLRHQNGSDRLEYPALAGETAEIARRFPTAQVLKKIAAIGGLRENLDRNVQEQIALEAAFLKVFAST
jgi:DNA polymerase III subunit delta'